MAVSEQRQIVFWSIGLAIFLVLVYWLSSVLLPFVAGFAVAYFLDPAVDRLEAFKMPRWLATTIVVAAFFLLILVVLVLLTPVIQAQLVLFADLLPGVLRGVKEHLGPQIEWLRERLPSDSSEKLGLALEDHAGKAVGWLLAGIGRVLSTGAAIASILSLLVITPIVAFYLLRDYDGIVAKIDDCLPRQHAPVIREQLGEIDRTIAGFVRGQATVCLLLGLYYGIGLSLVGLNAGFVIGLASGLLSFIPYVGMLLGFVVGVAVALAQFTEWTPVILVIVVFVTGQFLEGNFVTPKLVGDSVGLHPVWIIFALLAGGAVFGFVGLLLAVPVAAVIGVLVRFALGHYLSSPYYTGRPRGQATASEGPDQ